MLTLEMLPAWNGDALWIEYGDPSAPRRILIDGGRKKTLPILKTKIEALDVGERAFELIVLSHIDSDHIDGLLALIADKYISFDVGDFWLNGLKHLEAPPALPDELGAKEGELLSRALKRRRWPWNSAFSGEAIVVSESGPLPETILEGGLKLTILSPGRHHLAALALIWKAAVAELETPDEEESAKFPDVLGSLSPRQLSSENFYEDSTVPNGTSIALLLEYEEKKILLGADAHPEYLEESIERLLIQRGQVAPLVLDAFKVSHHGSKANTSPGLLSLIQCPRYLFSTNGAYEHPHEQTIARILCNDPDRLKSLIFNYRSKCSLVWNDDQLKNDFAFQTVFPDTSHPEGMRVEF